MGSQVGFRVDGFKGEGTIRFGGSGFRGEKVSRGFGFRIWSLGFID